MVLISIHAPLTGSDNEIFAGIAADAISIHAPLTGSDPKCGREFKLALYFNPRSPYGERQS